MLSRKVLRNVPEDLLKSSVVLGEWDVFLGTLFRPIPSVSKYHHLVFEAYSPGTVQVKVCIDDEFTSLNIPKMPEQTAQAATGLTSLAIGFVCDRSS